MTHNSGTTTPCAEYIQVGLITPQPPAVTTVYIPPCPRCAELEAELEESKETIASLELECAHRGAALKMVQPSALQAEVARLTGLVKTAYRAGHQDASSILAPWPFTEGWLAFQQREGLAQKGEST